MVKLDDQNKMVQHINAVIKEKNFNLKAFLATDGNYQEYVLFDEKGAVYASQQVEAIFARLDIMEIARKHGVLDEY